MLYFKKKRYSIEYIKDLINMRDSTESEYRKILLVKIIDELIKNYINIEGSCRKIEKLENENNKIINKIMSETQKVNISKKKIDELYIDIILNLIKNGKKDINSIIRELEMESINITKTIFKKIKDFLNDKEVIDKYLIKEMNDFNNKDKINFYYILLKLLKDSIFIYQFKFFLQTRKYFFKNSKKLKMILLKITKKLVKK